MSKWVLGVSALFALLLVVSASQLRGDTQAPAVEENGVTEKPVEETPAEEVPADAQSEGGAEDKDKDAAVDKSEEAAPAADTEQPTEHEVENKAEETDAKIDNHPDEKIIASNHPEDYKKKDEDNDEESSSEKVKSYVPSPAAAPVSGDDKEHGPKEIVDETKIVPEDDGSNNAPLSEKDNGPRVVKPAMSAEEKDARKCPQGFSYATNSKCGPEKWAAIRPAWSDCGKSGMQSPIHVDTGAVNKEADLQPLGVHYHMFESRMINNGHSIVLEPTLHHSAEYDKMLEDAKENDSILYEQLKSSKAGHIEMYGKKFVLRQMHFHASSEHTFDNVNKNGGAEETTSPAENVSSETEQTEAAGEQSAADAEKDKTSFEQAEQKAEAEGAEQKADTEAENAEETATNQAEEAAADASLYEKDEQKEINAVRNPISLVQVGEAPADADDNVDEPSEKHDNKEADEALAGDAKEKKDDESAAAPKEAEKKEKTVATTKYSEEKEAQVEADDDEEKQKRLREQVVASEADRLRDVPEKTKLKEPTPAGHYDMEMHLVHEAEDGQVLMIAVFFKALKTRNSEFLAKFWSRLPAHPVYNAQQVDEVGISVDPREALPTSGSYYTYEGSLSAPPCKFQWGEGNAPGSGVLWFLMKEPLYMSNEQLAHFHQFYNGNYRPVQELGGRTVFLYDEEAAQVKYTEEMRNGVDEAKLTKKPVEVPTQVDPPQGDIKEGQKDTPHIVTNAKNGMKVVMERKIEAEAKEGSAQQAPEGDHGELSPKQKVANQKAAKETNVTLPPNHPPPNSPSITGDTKHALHSNDGVKEVEKKGEETKAVEAGKAATKTSQKAADAAQESSNKDEAAAAQAAGAQ